MKKHLRPLTPVLLYARVSSDRQESTVRVRPTEGAQRSRLAAIYSRF